MNFIAITLSNSIASWIRLGSEISTEDGEKILVRESNRHITNALKKWDRSSCDKLYVDGLICTRY